MSAADRSRRARWFVAAGAVFLVVWGATTLLGMGRRTGVVLGLYGFVLHTVFGKAYSLVPTYFDRELSTPLAPAVQFPLSAGGTVLLAFAGEIGDPAATVGAVAWALGVAVFLVAIGWAVRDNLTGAETGTSDANARRRPVDRVANGFVPVALLYLAVGAYATAAGPTGLPPVVDGYPPRISHLLAAGGAAVLLFAVGFRLLPRFMVAHPPRALVWVVLPAGAVGPALVAVGLLDGGILHAGATLLALAVVGFAVTVGVLFHRSDRRRVGFYGVVAGAVAGVAGVALGLQFAFVERAPGLVVLHYRLILLGFLGLTIVGVGYQFYPPAVGRFPGADDRTALGSIALIAGGLVLEAAGHLGGLPIAVRGGHVATFAGSLLYAGLLLGVFYDRYRRR